MDYHSWQWRSFSNSLFFLKIKIRVCICSKCVFVHACVSLGWNLEVSGGNEGRVLWSNPRYLYGRIFYVGLLVIPHILGSGWECSDLSCSWCLFKHERSQTEREGERETKSRPEQGMMKLSPLPITCPPSRMYVADCRGKNHFRMVPALSLADIVKDNG